MSKFSLRIFILDSNHSRRSIIVSTLKQIGCQEVLSAGDGNKGLALLKQAGGVDILLLDPYMTTMDGLDFLHDVALASNVKALIFMGELAADVKRTLRQLSSQMGMQVLGELGNPLVLQTLKQQLHHFMSNQFLASPLPPMEQHPTRQAVNTALLEEQFDAYFQPTFDLRSGCVKNVEVLARWNHPTMGLIPPSTFLPVLEHMGLMDELWATMLYQGLNLQRKAQARGHSFNLAFNVEGPQLTHRSFSAKIKALLIDNNANGSDLTFEVTERNALDLTASMLENLVRLRMLGCQLAIDDFGSGYSSLMRLCHMPFTEIKLDKAFLRNVENDQCSQAAIASTLTLGANLGISVVFEGVETEVQRETLIALGGKFGQGHLCAHPMPAAKLLLWLEQQPSSPINHYHLADHARSKPPY